MRHGGNVWDEARPEDWLDYSANLRPEGTPEWVMETLRRAVTDTRYYPDRHMRMARQGLAAALGVGADCILPTAGGAQAIDLALSLDAGRVLVQMPTFGEYAERARAQGRAVAAWAEAQPGDTAVLCNPNNPTGEARTSAQVLADFMALREKGASLMVDEAFIDYCPECTVRSQVQPGLTVVGSLTKILCIPGVRLGYVCAAPETIHALEGRMLTWSLNSFAAAIAAELPTTRGRNGGGRGGHGCAAGGLRPCADGYGRAGAALSCAVSAGGFRTGYDGDRRSTAGKADSRPHLRFLWLAAPLFAAGGQDC